MSPFDLKIRRYSLQIGAKKPFRLLHISDNHFCDAAEGEPSLKKELSRRRIREFENDFGQAKPGCLHGFFQNMMNYAEQRDCLIVHTGDLIDFISEENLRQMKTTLARYPLLFMPGNHEYLTEIWPQYRYPQESLSYRDMEQCLPEHQSEFRSLTHNGVHLFGLNNARYQFTARQLQALKQTADDGMPLILFMHIMIHTTEYFRKTATPSHPCAYTVGTPEELMLGLYPDSLRQEQRPTKETRAMVNFIRQCPNIRLILCGHEHLPCDTELRPGLVQRVVGGGYLGHVCEYEIS